MVVLGKSADQKKDNIPNWNVFLQFPANAKSYQHTVLSKKPRIIIQSNTSDSSGWSPRQHCSYFSFLPWFAIKVSFWMHLFVTNRMIYTAHLMPCPSNKQSFILEWNLRWLDKPRYQHNGKKKSFVSFSLFFLGTWGKLQNTSSYTWKDTFGSSTVIRGVCERKCSSLSCTGNISVSGVNNLR